MVALDYLPNALICRTSSLDGGPHRNDSLQVFRLALRSTADGLTTCVRTRL